MNDHALYASMAHTRERPNPIEDVVESSDLNSGEKESQRFRAEP